jgi:hypothetical protein
MPDDRVQFQSPTTGQVQAVPPEHWDEALNRGYKPTSHTVMYSPEGKRGMVPNEQVAQLGKQGYQTTPKTQFEKERTTEGDRGFVSGAASFVKDAVSGAVPEFSKEGMKKWAVHALPNANEAENALNTIATARDKGIWAATKQFVGQQVGLNVPRIENRAAHADTAGVAGEVAIPATMALAGGAKEVLPARVTAPVVKFGEAAADLPRAIIKGTPPKALVPEAPKAMTQAIQPGVNIPRAEESIGIAGPRLQQLGRAGALKDLQGNPLSEIKNTGDMLGAVRSAKQHVLGAIEDRLGAVDALQVDTKPIANAMRDSITTRVRKQFPALAEGIEKRAATYEQPTSLREIENAIIDANDDLKGYYKQPVAGESPTSASIRATHAEVRALRSLLDEKVEALSGDGVKDLKREYGALRDVERATARQHAIATRTKEGGLWEGLSYLHAADAAFSGGALGAARALGGISIGKMLKTLRNPDYLLNQSFHGPKAFEPAEPIGKPPGPPAPKGLLPAPPTQLSGGDDTSGSVRGGRWTTPKALLEAPKPPAVKVSTDSMGIRWAESPEGYRVSIPKGVPEGDIENYATGKLAEQSRIHGEIVQRRESTPPKPSPQFTREEVRPSEQGSEYGPERRLGVTGRGGVRLTPKAELPESIEDERNAEVSSEEAATPNEIRAELSRTKQAARKWSDKFATARDAKRQTGYMENMNAADKRVNELQEALDTGKRIRLGARGATKNELTKTYQGLSGEMKDRADALLQQWQSADWAGREQMTQEYGLNSAQWKGLPIQEKLARFLSEKPKDWSKVFESLTKKMREPGEDEEVPF